MANILIENFHSFAAYYQAKNIEASPACNNYHYITPD